MKRLLLVAGITIAPVIAFSQGSYLNIMGIIRGDSLGSQFGKKVVPAGDVNGDTIPDFFVLATGDQKVYLFYGKKGGLDTLPNLFFEHKTQLELIGDINGDGGLDFAMRETGQTLQMSIYFGGICLDTLKDGFVKGESSGISFGDLFGVYFSAGKLSNNGVNQLMSGITDRGFDSTRFYFFNIASSSIDTLPFKTLDLELRDGVPAGPAVVLGDINGDVYADLAIGRTGQSSAFPGFVEIYFGGMVFDTIPDITLRPPSYVSSSATPFFGRRIAPLGDLNGDNLSDFIISVGSTPLLYFGGNPLDTLPQFTLDRIGKNFVNGKDINHDGYDDFIVGEPVNPITGFAYVYYGGPAMDSIVDLEIRELDLPFPAYDFGQTVAGLGDIDGNGSNDFAVGSTSNTDPDRGYLWVFNGLLPSTGVNDEKQNRPKNFQLGQNYPNPFNSSTVIQYYLTKQISVSLELFNIVGQGVRVLIDGEQYAGNHKIIWDGTDSLGKLLPSGIYFYKLKVGEESLVKKMVLLK